MRILIYLAALFFVNYINASDLHEASLRGDIVQLESILDSDFDINAADDQGFSPLHIAVINNQIQAMKILLLKGANTEVSDNNGNTPLHYAARAANKEAIDLLMEYNAAVNAKNLEKFTPLLLAALENNLAILKLLLSYGAHTNSCTNKNLSAMDYAVKMNNQAMVRILLERGMQVDENSYHCGQFVHRYIEDVTFDDPRIFCNIKILSIFLGYKLGLKVYELFPISKEVSNEYRINELIDEVTGNFELVDQALVLQEALQVFNNLKQR